MGFSYVQFDQPDYTGWPDTAPEEDAISGLLVIPVTDDYRWIATGTATVTDFVGARREST